MSEPTKVYVLFIDESGCCHLDLPHSVHASFADALAAGLAWRSAYHAERRARRAGHTEEADDPPFDVIEYEVGKTYEGGWPRFKPGSSSVPYTPTEALKAS